MQGSGERAPAAGRGLQIASDFQLMEQESVWWGLKRHFSSPSPAPLECDLPADQLGMAAGGFRSDALSWAPGPGLGSRVLGAVTTCHRQPRLGKEEAAVGRPLPAMLRRSKGPWTLAESPLAVLAAAPAWLCCTAHRCDLKMFQGPA